LTVVGFVVAVVDLVRFIGVGLRLALRRGPNGVLALDLGGGRLVLKVRPAAEHEFDLLERLALGLRHQKVHVDDAGRAKAHVEEERAVQVERVRQPHVVETEHDGEGACQIEARRERSQQASVLAKKNIEPPSINQWLSLSSIMHACYT